MDYTLWSLRRKVGQLVVAGFDGYTVTEGMHDLIRNHHLGGVILFSRNIDTPEQVCRLNEELQAIAATGSGNEPGTPLLIATDQEGGNNIHVRRGITLTPGNMAIGASGSEEGAYQAAHISGSELRQLGINLNYGPDVDVNNNPRNPVIGVRSFGEDPRQVGRMGAAAVRGFQDAGISATAKHFPGHGDTSIDSHHDLPVIAHPMARLEEVELVPFRQAIDAGVDMIMTAHVVFPELVPEGTPATLSHRIVTGLLREQLQYDGVITTDCLEMKAIAATYGTPKGAVRALQAGCDLVLVCHTYAEQLAVIEAIVAAAEAGEISEAQIDASVGRILAMKERRRMNEHQPWSEQTGAALQTPERIEAMRALTGQSVTLVRQGGSLPVGPDEQVLVVRVKERLHSGEDDQAAPLLSLAEALEHSGIAVQETVVSSAPDHEERVRTFAATQASERIIVQTSNTLASPAQGELVRSLLEQHPGAIVAAMRSPYDVQAFSAAETYIACYDHLPLAVETLADIVLGRKQATGRLPISLQLPE